MRDKLYAVIGFSKCNEVEFPKELKSRKITNPDAPANEHCILVRVQGKDTWVIPIIFSGSEKYDMAHGGEFFDYLQFQFLVVERDGNGPGVKASYDGGAARLVDPRNATGFFEQVGRNTQYIIHPEEILADNFALLVLEQHGVPSPAIISKMGEVLKRGAPAKPVAAKEGNQGVGSGV